MAKKSVEKLIEESARSTKRDFNSVHKTIEDLARSTKQGFDNVHKNFEDLHKTIISLAHGQELLKADVADIKTTLGPIIQIVGQQTKEMYQLEARVSRLERKTGISKIR